MDSLVGGYESHSPPPTGGRRVWWMMDGLMDGWWCGCSNPPHSNQPLLKRECDDELIDDDGRAGAAGGAGSCTWPVAISFQIFCHFKKAVAMIFVCLVVGHQSWNDWWMDELIVCCDWIACCELCMGCWMCLCINSVWQYDGDVWCMSWLCVGFLAWCSGLCMGCWRCLLMNIYICIRRRM